MTEPPNCCDRDLFDKALDKAAEGMGLGVNRAQRAMMWAHFQYVLEANRQFNLTRITAPADAAVKHYADSVSLLCVPDIHSGGPLTVLDVGTGAGFPAVPLAIMCREWRIVAIDGTGKKVRFVAETVAALGLANVEARQVRAADLGRQMAERFDLVVLRAVSKLAAGLDEVHRVVRPGGEVILYKTVGIARDELAQGNRTARKLGLQPLDPVDVSVPSPEGPILRRFIRYRRPASGQGA